MHSGSCLCKQVKFEVDGDFDSFYLCHCTYCQKDSGSAHSANLFAMKSKLKWISGESELKTYVLPTTRHQKSFCKECGSALPYQQGPLLVVPAGSLDTKVELKPAAHLFCSSKASWDENLESIKKLETLP